MAFVLWFMSNELAVGASAGRVAILISCTGALLTLAA